MGKKKADIWQGKAANGVKLTIRRRSNKPVGKEVVEQLITLHKDKKQLTQVNVLWCGGENDAIEVVKDMAMRYSKGEIDDEQVEAEKRVIRAKWMKEQRKLNTVKRRPAATGVTGETKVVKEKAGDTEAEPDRQHEEAQTKARRKGTEKAQKRARVNTPANAISPPPSPPSWLQRMVHDFTAIAGP